MEDSKVEREEQIRDETLMMEEAHYVHTMNAFVELIVLYGWDTVIGDLRTAMGEKQW
jgi:hypothetical protein